MSFLTGLTYQNVIDRESAIADYITDYATTLVTRINEAKAVVDNRLRAYGYDLDKLGQKDYFFNLDNTGGAEDIKTITGIASTQRLLILAIHKGEALGVILKDTSETITYLFDTLDTSASILYSWVLPNIGSDLKLTIEAPNEDVTTPNSIVAYLTDPALYFVHLYKALELIFEGMRSNSGDLFEMKSNYYRELYESEFNNLVTIYDADGDGNASTTEMRSIKQTRMLR